MTTIPLGADSQVIALACSTIALSDARTVKPLSPPEWHDLTLALRRSELDRPRDLLGLSSAELQNALGLGTSAAGRLEHLLSRGGQLAFEIERLNGLGVWVLTRADDAYPSLLKQRLRGHAPPLLFGAGSQELLERQAIAVVGSRDVDEAALEFADTFGRQCARQRVAVVSGAARGVDATAMQGVLDAGGNAIGMTVDPLERLVRRRDLRGPLTDETLVLATPFHPHARWHAGNAMRRNRLIYAIARAAVVVASSIESGGTRAGALENLKNRWVPLHVRDDGSPGNRQLIAEGGLPLPVAGVAELELEQLFTVNAPPSLLDEPLGGAEAPHEESNDDEPEREAARYASVNSEASSREHEASAAGQCSLFEVVWPWLERYLAEPRTVEDVATRFDVVTTQARAWLKRAADDGLVQVRARPRRYVVDETGQDNLFVPTRD
jgi:predicted Rossmann fold nucleotide-binding protein DprA/Smf involved in DNA uptake